MNLVTPKGRSSLAEARLKDMLKALVETRLMPKGDGEGYEHKQDE